MIKRICLSFLATLHLQASPLEALYATLDPTSVAQHFAFYELYPDAKEGRKALRHAWDLLAGGLVWRAIQNSSSPRSTQNRS